MVPHDAVPSQKGIFTSIRALGCTIPSSSTNQFVRVNYTTTTATSRAPEKRCVCQFLKKNPNQLLSSYYNQGILFNFFANQMKFQTRINEPI